MRADLPIATAQRSGTLPVPAPAARGKAVARRFDEALRPVGLRNGQFPLLIALNRPEPPRIDDLAPFLATDGTTLAANGKPLERRGLLEVVPGAKDHRSRHLGLTEAGRDLFVQAMPIWRAVHKEVDEDIPEMDGEALRRDIHTLAMRRTRSCAAGRRLRRA